MPVSSLIIHTKKEQTDSVSHALKLLNGVEVEKVHNEDIVVVTETPSQKDDKELWKKIEELSGVIQCDLIYHNFEDDPQP